MFASSQNLQKLCKLATCAHFRDACHECASEHIYAPVQVVNMLKEGLGPAEHALMTLNVMGVTPSGCTADHAHAASLLLHDVTTARQYMMTHLADTSTITKKEACPVTCISTRMCQGMISLICSHSCRLILRT